MSAEASLHTRSSCFLSRPIAVKPSHPSFICSTDCAVSNRLPVNSGENIRWEMAWCVAGCEGSRSVAGRDVKERVSGMQYHLFLLEEENGEGKAGVSQESNGKEAVGQNAKRAWDMPVDATLARTYQSKSGSGQRCHVGNGSGDRGNRTKSWVKDLYLLCTVKC